MAPKGAGSSPVAHPIYVGVSKWFKRFLSYPPRGFARLNPFLKEVEIVLK